MEKQIIVNCIEDAEFEYTRDVVYSCGQTFKIDKTNVFNILCVNHFSEVVKCYYTLCPYCGYIVLLNENELVNEMKLNADKMRIEDPYLFKKNILKSQLIHLESKTSKIRKRVL